MSRFQSQIRPAPSGMNTQADLPALPPERSRYIKGFLPSRAGKLHLSHLLNSLPGVVTGLKVAGHAWYADGHAPTAAEYASGSETRSRLLVWYVGGMVRAFSIAMRGRWPYCVATHIADLPDPGEEIEREYAPGQQAALEHRQIRWVQLDDELFWCRSDGSRIRRIYQDADGRLWHHLAGIDAPESSYVAAVRCKLPGAEGVLYPSEQWEGNASAPVTAQYSYAVTYADEKFRESNYTAEYAVPEQSHNELGDSTQVRVFWPSDHQVKYAFVYRAAIGTTDYYRIPIYVWGGNDYDGGYQRREYLERPAVAPGGTDFWAGGYDITSEADLVTGTLAPEIGANTPPNQASILAVHDRRLIANDRTLNSGIGISVNRTDVESLRRIQISNLNAPTQFNVSDASLPELGTQLIVGTNPNDEVTGLRSLGALFGIWNRRSRWVLYGSSMQDWALKYVDRCGCVAPNSIAEADNAVFWLSEDGVYAVGYDSGLAATCVSREVDGLFTGYASGSVFAGGVVSD